MGLRPIGCAMISVPRRLAQGVIILRAQGLAEFVQGRLDLIGDGLGAIPGGAGHSFPLCSGDARRPP
jgi:hypothetical protein